MKNSPWDKWSRGPQFHPGTWPLQQSLHLLGLRHGRCGRCGECECLRVILKFKNANFQKLSLFPPCDFKKALEMSSLVGMPETKSAIPWASSLVASLTYHGWMDGWMDGWITNVCILKTRFCKYWKFPYFIYELFPWMKTFWSFWCSLPFPLPYLKVLK